MPATETAARSIGQTLEVGTKVAATKHFDYIDGLRGFLAVYVACHHFLGWNMAADLPRPLRMIGALFTFGHPAVCGFIVLSGFSLMLPVAGSADSRRAGFWNYLSRRGGYSPHTMRLLPYRWPRYSWRRRWIRQLSTTFPLSLSYRICC